MPEVQKTLLERLQACKSRKQARNEIAKYCNECELNPNELVLSSAETKVFAALH